MDPKDFVGLASVLFSEEYPNCFELGFSQFLADEFLNTDGDTIELTAVDISEAKFPAGWGDTHKDIAFINADGVPCGLMDTELFNVFHLQLGKTYNCFIQRRYANGGAIWVPYLES